MTAVLLDTHAYVWSLSNPGRLGDRARRLIEDPTTTLLVSAASAWEMAIKHHAGRWPEAEPLLRRHEDLVARLGATALPISCRDAIGAGGLSWAHRDPFDRMLAIQALTHPAQLATADAVFNDVEGLGICW